MTGEKALLRALFDLLNEEYAADEHKSWGQREGAAEAIHRIFLGAGRRTIEYLAASGGDGNTEPAPSRVRATPRDGGGVAESPERKEPSGEAAWEKFEGPLIEAVTELLRADVHISDIVRRVEEIAEFEADDDA